MSSDLGTPPLPPPPIDGPTIPMIDLHPGEGSVRRIARFLQAAAGVVLILIADILFGVWVGHVWLAVSWLALGAAAATLALGMLATRHGRRTRRRSRFVRGAAFVGACAALGVAAWCVGRAWRPYEPLTLSDAVHVRFGAATPPLL